MADYKPPTENLPIFDKSVFTTDTTVLTQGGADNRYLRYPNAQGPENLVDINVGGNATFDGLIQIQSYDKRIEGTSGPDLSIANDLGSIYIGTSAGLYSFGNNKLNLNDNSLYFTSDYTKYITTDSSNIYLYNETANGAFKIYAMTPSGMTNPLNINGTTTGINNSTTINDLTSTTKPVGTNTTAVATTAFVQSALSGYTPNIIPFLYGFSGLYNNFSPVPSAIGFNFTNGALVGVNVFFTLRIQAMYVYSGSTSGIMPYYNNYTLLLDIYPNRVPTVYTTAICLPNGTINGNNAYVMTDATYAPNGRWYWSRNYNNSRIDGTVSPVTDPFYLTSNAQSSVTLNFIPPVVPPTAGSWRFECSMELINKGTGTTVTTIGVGNTFSGGTGGSYYTSFGV